MLSVYVPRGTTLERVSGRRRTATYRKTRSGSISSVRRQQEDKLVERVVGIAVPTREEMQEIEVTSRLYVENGARYMTATLMCQSDTDSPKTTAVTFILVRPPADHGALRRAAAVHDRRHTSSPAICPAGVTGETRADGPARRRHRSRRRHPGADRRSRSTRSRTRSSSRRSRSPSARKATTDILKTIGRKGDLTSKVRESLVSIGRLLLYLANEADSMRWAKDPRAQLKGMQRDVQSLVRPRHLSVQQDHRSCSTPCSASSPSSRTTSSRSSRSPPWCCMPPTLVASIYGMNFKHMPELDWTLRLPDGDRADDRWRRSCRTISSNGRSGCNRSQQSAAGHQKPKSLLL